MKHNTYFHVTYAPETSKYKEIRMSDYGVP